MNYNLIAKDYIRIYGLWRAPPNDVVFAQYTNYRVSLCEKITSARNHIAYLEDRISDPDLNQKIKDSYFIPSLKRQIISLLIFEKQGSVLAA